jgi:hypothetical protein
VNETATTFDVIELFKQASTRGRSLDAVLALSDVAISTIVTPFDMPNLLMAGRIG